MIVASSILPSLSPNELSRIVSRQRAVRRYSSRGLLTPNSIAAGSGQKTTMSARDPPANQLAANGQKIVRPVSTANGAGTGAGVDPQQQLPYRLVPLSPPRAPPKAVPGGTSRPSPVSTGPDPARATAGPEPIRAPAKATRALTTSVPLLVPSSFSGSGTGSSSGSVVAQLSIVPFGAAARTSPTSSTAQKATQTELTAEKQQQQVQKRKQPEQTAPESNKPKQPVNAHTLILSLDQMLRAELPSDPLRARLLAYAAARGYPLAQRAQLGDPLTSPKQQQHQHQYRLRSLLRPPSPPTAASQNPLPKQISDQLPPSSSGRDRETQKQHHSPTASCWSQRSSLSSGSGAGAQAANTHNLCTARATRSQRQWQRRELVREHEMLATAQERWLFEFPFERADLPDEVRARVADMRHLVALTTRLETEAAAEKAEAAAKNKANGKRQRKKRQVRNGNGGAQQSRLPLLNMA